MNISSAIFHCSSPDLDSCPDESLPEFAFIGRSNVGKSSLLNMISRQEDLARVSRRPGFTKLINIFTMNKNWRLVDLPGYGFAQAAKKEASRFNSMVAEYLEERPNLVCVFTLIEAGLPPQQIDIEFLEWLAVHEIPFVLVFTKADKVSDETIQENIAAFKERIAPWFEVLPAIYTCSAKTEQGRQELLGVIDEELKAIEAKARQARIDSGELPIGSRKPSLPQAPKKRPDRSRPW